VEKLKGIPALAASYWRLSLTASMMVRGRGGANGPCIAYSSY
jgi:hypothetical protein